MNARVGGGREPDASPIISCAPGSLLLGSPGRHAFLNHAVTFGVRERSGRTVLSATLAGVATNRVDQLGAAVDAEMRLHATIPLVALSCLMHLGIARLVGILGRGRRIDDRVATFSPLTASCRRTSSNSCRPRSMPTNRRIASES
jgi:hypothetical protein